MKSRTEIVSELRFLLVKKNDQLKIAEKDCNEFKIRYDKIKNARLRMCSDYGLAEKLSNLECIKNSIKEIEKILGM